MDKSKQGQLSLQIDLTITSEDEKTFLAPKTLESVSAVCRETGFSNVGIISAYNSKRATMKKRSNGFVCHFRLGELNTPPKVREAPRIIISVQEL